MEAKFTSHAEYVTEIAATGVAAYESMPDYVRLTVRNYPFNADVLMEKSVAAVEQMAVELWHSESLWTDVEARLFGAAEVLRSIGQDRAAKLAFWLASLAGHLWEPEKLPKPKQAGFASMGGH